jgi:hypothetical protein
MPMLIDDRHETDAGVERGRGSAYNKASIEARDKLISKLRNMSICRGC